MPMRPAGRPWRLGEMLGAMLRAGSGAGRRAASGPIHPPPQSPGLGPVLERDIRALQPRPQREEKSGDRRGADRGGDHLVHRQHAVRLPAPRLRRLLRGGRPRLGPRRPGLGFLARPPRDGRLGRGQLALDFRAGQPEPHAAAADKRADLDPQISLLAEHEVTRLVTPVSALAARIASRPRPTRYSGRSPWTSRPMPCSMSPRRRIRKRSSTEARAT